MPAQICIARIGAAHGVRGAVKLWTFTEDPFAVQHYGPLTTKDGSRQFEVATAREAKGHLVAMTGFGTHKDRNEALEAGFDAHLTKPVAPEALASLIAHLPGPPGEA